MDPPDQPMQFRTQSFSSEHSQKRTKERSVAQAYELVTQWRKLFDDGIVVDNRVQRLNLQDAANHVGIPKKTLEDYHAIFRKLKEEGYDINEYKNEKMGLLRALVRRSKDQPKQNQQHEIEQQQIMQPRQYQESGIIATENYGELIIEQREFCSSGLCEQENISDEHRILQMQTSTYNFLSFSKRTSINNELINQLKEEIHEE